MRTVPKVPLIVAGLVLVALGAGIVVRVLGPSADDSTTSDPEAASPSGTEGLGPDATTAPSTAATTEAGQPTTTRPEVDLQELRAAIAQGFSDDFAPLLDSDEADCLAQAVLDVFTVERLYELHESMASPGAVPDAPDLWPTTSAEREELDRQMRPCVPPETADRLNL